MPDYLPLSLSIQHLKLPFLADNNNDSLVASFVANLLHLFPLTGFSMLLQSLIKFDTGEGAGGWLSFEFPS